MCYRIGDIHEGYNNSTNFIPSDYSDNFLKKTVITLIMSTYIYDV